MDLPKVTDLNVAGKRVLLRLDLDIKPDPNDLRIKASEATLDYLKDQKAKITIIAHRGRPKGKIDANLSLKPFGPIFSRWGASVEENLRFNPGEEANDEAFARRLAGLGDFYVNEAFASSHRAHASIVGVPRFLPHAAGMRFEKEVENLSHVARDSDRPLVVIISGIKKDKIEMIKKLSSLADKVLVGGRLPEYLGDEALKSVRLQDENEKVIVGNLIMDKEDITLNTIVRFEKEIKKAKTIILAGVLGKYEDEGHRQGTVKIFNAVADSNAYRIAGGGDTEEALTAFGLLDEFDWVSVGGGAMLDYLTHKTLPGIEALNKRDFLLKTSGLEKERSG